MKHGVHIPKNKRPAMAERAYLLRTRDCLSYDEIAGELNVSNPTARNLVSAGKRLADREGE